MNVATREYPQLRPTNDNFMPIDILTAGVSGVGLVIRLAIESLRLGDDRIDTVS